VRAPTLLRRPSVRRLTGRDLPEVWALLDAAPVSNVFLAARLAEVGLDRWRLGGEIWGYGQPGQVEAACYAGANLVPVNANQAAARAFGERARRYGRQCSSIVGPAEAVEGMWEVLERAWGPARDCRWRQPVLALADDPDVPADPRVRRVRMDELDLLMPAAVAMFTEEVGVSPLTEDGGRLYRSRMADLVRTGRAYARIEDGRVIFKAEVGAVASKVCQVQGVWTHPRHRGQGVATAGMSAVVRLARRSLAPIVSLYVNDYNLPARAAYAKVGFQQVDTFASIMF
jgi:uncharacterized protein